MMIWLDYLGEYGKRWMIPGLLGCLLVGVTLGCRENSSPLQGGPYASKHGHVHVPPHGGTPVILGEEDFHLEFVHVPQSGTLRCYVLDGHMNDFIRLAQPAIRLAVRRVGQETDETLELRAVTTAATGETEGDTSQFEYQAEWLRNYPIAFDGQIAHVMVRGISYSNVSFTFPVADY